MRGCFGVKPKDLRMSNNADFFRVKGMSVQVPPAGGPCWWEVDSIAVSLYSVQCCRLDEGFGLSASDDTQYTWLLNKTGIMDLVHWCRVDLAEETPGAR